MSQQTVKEAVLATVEAIKKDAAMAKVRYKAHTQWEEDVRCTGRVREFDPMVIDEPAAFGGADSAVSPADVVLVALGTCQEIMYVALASTMDIPLDEVKVDVNADLDLNGLMGLDPETPPGLLEMSYDVHIKSPAPVWQAQTARTCIDGHLEERHVNDPAVSHLEMDVAARWAPLSLSVATMTWRSRIERARRSMRVTTSVSPG